MKGKSKHFWEATKVRLQLLKIWFVKNISVFVKVIIVVGFILILCGIIDNTIPVIGEISEEFEKIASADSWKIIVNSLAAISSILFSVYMFVRKTRRIAIEDIKSKKLKIALIKANLYFDENGRLRKKPKTNKVDIEEENNVGITNIDNLPKENLIDGVVRATSELGLILTTNINTEKDEDKILQDAQLNEATEQVKAEQVEAVKKAKKEKKEHKSNAVGRFFKRMWSKGVSFVKPKIDNLKLSINSLKEPKLDKMNTKKKKKLELEEENNIIPSVEIVDENNSTMEDIKSEVKVHNEVKEEKLTPAPAVNKNIVSEVTPKKTILDPSSQQQAAKQHKQKQINDILSSLK